MYDTVSKNEVNVEERTGNWVAPYSCLEDIREYVQTQFGDRTRIINDYLV